MTWTSDQAAVEAERTTDKRTARWLKSLADRLAKQPAQWEHDLIARLTVVAAFGLDQRIDNLVDLTTFVAVVGKESGGYTTASRQNANGSNDLGWLMINSVHRVTDSTRLSRSDSLMFVRTTLIRRRIERGQHPLQDFNAYTSGAYEPLIPYATKAVANALAVRP